MTADPPRAEDRAFSPVGSRLPVEAPSQRDPAAAHEERGVVQPPARGVYPATKTAHATLVLIHIFRCTTFIFAADAAATTIPCCAPVPAAGVEVSLPPTSIPSLSFCQNPPSPPTSCCLPGPPPPPPPAAPPPPARLGQKNCSIAQPHQPPQRRRHPCPPAAFPAHWR